MTTPFSQRWVALLAMPLVASAYTLHLPTATAASLQPTPASVQSTPVRSLVVAQRSRVQRVRFAPGADSATIKTSVVNGTRDMYLLGAEKGQTMQIKLTSLENNAVFNLVAPPNGTKPRQMLQQEVVTWSDVLPETGDYQIIVGSTRGNASYRLEVTVR